MEISCYELSDRTSPTPPASAHDWAEYFAACREDVGLGHLEPIEGAQELFLVTRLDKLALGVLAEQAIKHLAAVLPGSPSSWTSEQVCSNRMSLDGGIAILGSAGEIYARPGCCADIGCLREWTEALAPATAGQESHPWCGHDAEIISIQRSNLEEVTLGISGTQEPRQFTLDLSDTVQQFQRMNDEASELASGLAEMLVSVVPDRQIREHLAHSMAGVD